MKTDYSWQAWAFVAVFAVGAIFKTCADQRVARATENLAYYTGVQALVVKDAAECYENTLLDKRWCRTVTDERMFQDLTALPPNR